MSTGSGMGPERKTIDELLRESRARLDRLAAEDAHAAAHRGALLVDIRSEPQREADGAVPGALCIPRNVLEWRLDPSSGHQDPSVGGLDRHVVLMCNEGYQSSLRRPRFRRSALPARPTWWAASRPGATPDCRWSPRDKSRRETRRRAFQAIGGEMIRSDIC
jgi:rhodanese-related sulfurtransferase